MQPGHQERRHFAAQGRRGLLVLARRAGECIRIGHDVKATGVLLFGDVVRIGIDAPSTVGVHRQEVYLELQQANLRAAASTSGESARSAGAHSTG